MKKILALTAMVALFLSCETEKKQEVAFDYITKESNKECKGVNCPLIDISYPQITTADFPLEEINKHIEQAVVAIIKSAPEDEVVGVSVDDAVASFKKEFETLRKDFPDSDAGFEAKVKGIISYQSDSLISVKLNSFMYTGGAHGYTATKYININSNTGAVIANEALFKDVASFKKHAEKAFRKHEKLADNVLLKDAGYWFENDVFQLPENIGISKTDIILFYNPYEITPYSEGPIEIKLPLSTMKDKLQYL
ncbi:DUF3298 and DUF4163 domain-containing protein [Neptunitalea lumnitzerae]|uniref:DUF3298/DUF4163 domain-containing protein n=1 Tax=Neptunitalea lumnitzerae TaxID=2965509 RepID=A0ABQ5MF46_9FLAO|nr:DUF3298 and DUF4163 domain-containing protein [Neptunitalea sp. Y10]GLB48014.1 hypothetical protein Y10_03820 [Neptunitalea sp. Y10]